MTGPAVSKHLRVLERAGLVSRSRVATARPATLEAAPLEQVAEWAEEFRQFWDERFDRLDDYLTTMTDERRTTRETPLARHLCRDPRPTTPRSWCAASSGHRRPGCGGR